MEIEEAAMVPELDYMNSGKLTEKAIDTQNKLDAVRLKLMEARALKSSLKNIYGCSNQLYKEVTSEELQKLTEERTRTFLNFKSAQAAIRAAESNKILTAALKLDNKDEITLEPEEEVYVRELLEEQEELTKDLMKEQDIGVQQELQIIELRTELGGLFCKYQQLRIDAEKEGKEITEPEGDQSTVDGIEELHMNTKHEEYRVNQIRLMIQKIMMKEKKLGMLFDEDTNAKFKKMFFRCGMSPEELRNEYDESKEPMY